MGFWAGLEVIVSLWPGLASPQPCPGCTQGVRACVHVRVRVCFFNVHVCQVRDQPWLGQPTLAFLSLVLAWAVAMFWGEERSL